VKIETHTTHSTEETLELGRSLAKSLGNNAVVYLSGQLGAGKTVLAKGFFEAHGIPASRVTSPSYSLINRYNTDPPLHHVDLYRIENQIELPDLGIDEIMEEPGLTLIEWGERLGPGHREPDLKIEIEVGDDDSREIKLTYT
jgi:tRNA threonylcarbamoyladenosine biosynthesis protein TsaE